METSFESDEIGNGNFFLSEEDMLRLYDDEYLSPDSHLAQCTEGVLGSLQTQLFTLLILTIIQRLISLTVLPSVLKNFVVTVCGLYALWDNVDDKALFSTIVAVTLSCLLFILYVPFSRKGPFITLLCLSSILITEYSLPAMTASSVRGILMILSMKMSSLAFDFSHLPLPLFSTISFLFNPSTLLFGPFSSFHEYTNSQKRTSFKLELRSWLISALCLSVSLICVLFSSCYLDVLPLPQAYSTALSFRSSHYFISFLSQGLFYLAGGAGQVARPHNIELPRSMVEVVISWNVPMHNYLWKYVYRNNVKYGQFVAIFLTFLVSASLHGLNFQLSAVLFTLGYICYTENVVRNGLSRWLSACVRSKSCVKCNHTRKSNSPLTITINIAFSLLTIYNLIYLGMVFDGSQDETGYSWRHTLSVWSNHHFAGHIVIAILTLPTFFL